MVHVYLYSSLLATLLVFNAHAAPTYNPNILLKRQNEPFDGPQTVQTHDVIKVDGGNTVRDCTVVFTPIVVGAENLVREERTCTDVFVPDGQQLPPPPPPPVVTSTPPPASTSAPPPPPADTTTTTDPAQTVAPLPPADTTSTDSVSTPEVDAPTTTTDPAQPTNDPAPPPADSTTANSGGVSTTDPASDTAPGTTSDGAAGNGTGSESVVVVGPTSAPADPTTPESPTGSRANNEAGPTTSAPSNVEIPGKKFEVLPIGLGVFAGISVIALIVVGLVTYERTKYRKAFRARRLAANGAEMGYGGNGMSERR